MNKADAHYKKMTETPVVKLIIFLGIPTTISMLVTNIYNLVDTYFVGTLGESPQGAIGILFTLQAIIQAFSFMLGHGSGTHVSKALADKNIDEASKYVSSAFFSGALIGTLLMVFGLIFLEPFMYLLGSTNTILPYAKEYGFWVYLREDWHNMSNYGVHFNSELDLFLKQDCQMKFEETHTREEFIALIGQSFL